MQNLVSTLYLDAITVHHYQISINMVPDDSYRNNKWSLSCRLYHLELICILLVWINFLKEPNLDDISIGIQSSYNLR